MVTWREPCPARHAEIEGVIALPAYFPAAFSSSIFFFRHTMTGC